MQNMANSTSIILLNFPHEEDFPNQTSFLLEFVVDLRDDCRFVGITILVPEGFSPPPPLFRNGPDWTFISSSGTNGEEEALPSAFEEASDCNTDLSLVNVPPITTVSNENRVSRANAADNC